MPRAATWSLGLSGCSPHEGGGVGWLVFIPYYPAPPTVLKPICFLNFRAS